MMRVYPIVVHSHHKQTIFNREREKKNAPEPLRGTIDDTFIYNLPEHFYFVCDAVAEEAVAYFGFFG